MTRKMPTSGALGFALALPVAWLAPPFLVGIALAVAGVLWSGESDLPVEASFAWGYAGAVVVPIAALIAARVGSFSGLQTAAVFCIVVAAYVVGSYMAILGIIVVDSTLNPWPDQWD